MRDRTAVSLRSSRRRHAHVALLGALAVALVGCAPFKTPVIPPLGVIYTDVSAPLMPPSTDIGEVDLSQVEIHTSQLQIPYLYGGSISLAWGDAAIQQAIEESGFSRVEMVDYHFFTILSIYSEFTVRVYGLP